MSRLPRIVLILASLALPLAACETFDPDKLFDFDFLSQKKPLPGDRKPVFPEGVPGVQRGVPAEYVKGYQPPPEAEPAPAATQQRGQPQQQGQQQQGPQRQQQETSSGPKPTRATVSTKLPPPQQQPGDPQAQDPPPPAR